jgi:hypothetical protein
MNAKDPWVGDDRRAGQLIALLLVHHHSSNIEMNVDSLDFAAWWSTEHPTFERAFHSEESCW